MSAIDTEYGALQMMTPATDAFLGAIVTLPKVFARRVRKQVVVHYWTMQSRVQLIWNVIGIRRLQIA